MLRTKPISREKLMMNLDSKRAWLRAGFFRKLSIAGIALGLLGCLSLEAEEPISFSSFQLQGLFSEHRFASPSCDSFKLTLAAQPDQSLHLLETWPLTLFKKVEGEEDLEYDGSVTLFRKPMPSRFAYHSWAGLRTGWGRYCSADTFGRSRTNGVGIEDPYFLYVKMSFRF